MQEYIMKSGGTIRTRVVLDDFVRDDNGKIIGAKVRENYDFIFDPLKNEDDNKSGIVKFYKINGGVVMATGGFAYDVNFRQTVDPKITADLDCTNHYGATAYALKTMMRNGADTVDLKWIQLGPWGSPDEKGFGIAPVFAIPAFSYGVMVDARTGKRFVNELADRKIRSDAILKMHKNLDGSITHPVVICDSIGAQGTTKANVQRGIDKKVIRVFDTLKELADFYKIPYEGLKKTVDDYTRYSKNGKDEEFDKPFFKFNDMIPDLTKPPFCAWQALPKVHHTMGGVKIDTEARVIDKNGNIIEGLFSAGEAVGGPHGASRLGSCAIPDCLVFGRIAGKNAANLAKKEKKC
ncbi:flavocytochrome c [Campylobacter hyointestinalis]|uniref:flavocytochrome c n=1 Tax=Campylobacter hyointestinalis TaxID=198 RepID=UPI00215885E5|nr:flavocytochrome c [Campylobacter hyointestinalis]